MINKNSSLKTKDARETAKQRRKKENNEFKHLSNQLPIQSEIMDKLDKVSIIRLTVNYLKLKIILNKSKLLYPSMIFIYIINNHQKFQIK